MVLWKNNQKNIFSTDPSDGYDQKTCCSRAGVKDDCMPMCQYNASLSEVRSLSNLCKDDLVKVTKCAAGNVFFQMNYKIQGLRSLTI